MSLMFNISIIDNQTITKLDLTENKDLESLTISNCPITKLDLTENKDLESLTISNCKELTIVKLSNVADLKIKISECPKLTILDIQYNNFELVTCNSLYLGKGLYNLKELCLTDFNEVVVEDQILPNLKEIDLQYISHLNFNLTNCINLKKLNIYKCNKSFSK